MAKDRRLKGVPYNLLGTFTSRYSEFDGYWLFGFLVGGEPLEIDLLRSFDETYGVEPAQWAANLSRRMFAVQLEKAGLTPSAVRTAHLAIVTGPEEFDWEVGWPPKVRRCQKLLIQARAESNLGKTYEAGWLWLPVAPNDPTLESQSFPFPPRPDSRTRDKTA